MADTCKNLILEIQQRNGNKTCIDCNAPNPQWASVNLGTFFCLECSGQHRALGVHLSFVRSITMDRWSPEQIKKMEVAGNKKALEFFQSQPGYSPGASIKEKYSGQVAESWRQKVSAEAERREWTHSTITAKQTSTLGMRNSPVPESRPFSANSGTGDTFASNTSSIGSSNYGSTENFNSNKIRNEEYFASKGNENFNRPDNLPPSQGGRYSGFGNSLPKETQQGEFSANDLLQDPMAALNKGWSMFSYKAVAALDTLGTAAAHGARIAAETAGTLSHKVNENIIRPTAETVRDPNFGRNVGTYVNTLGRTVAEGGARGVHAVSEFVSGNSTSTNSNPSAPYSPNNTLSANSDSYDFFAAVDSSSEPKNGVNDSGRTYRQTSSPAVERKASPRLTRKPVAQTTTEDWGHDGDWADF